MSYVVEAGASRSRRARQRRALITLAVVALLLFFAFWYAYSYYQDSDKARAAPSPTCTTATTTAALLPAQVTVNIYNATDRNGLAAKTAADVRKRGFKVSAVSNDPLDKTVTTAAEVRFGTKGAASSKLVLALVKGSKAVKDKRTDATVDLVLGDRFTALVAPPKPAAASSSATGGC
jgi:hypothetical protein